MLPASHGRGAPQDPHTQPRSQPCAHQPLSTPGPPHAPDSVVNRHGLLGGASDGVVVLEEAQVAAGVAQQGVVGERVPAISASAAGVGKRQAVQDLCPPAQGQGHQGSRLQRPTSGPSRARTESRGGAASPACPGANGARSVHSPRTGAWLWWGQAGGTRCPGAGKGFGTGWAVPGPPPACWWLGTDWGTTGAPGCSLCPPRTPPALGPAQFPSPEVGLQHPVQALVERPGGVVARPVVILPVRIGEEIPTQHREPRRLHPRHNAHLLVQSIKVVRERPKLCLQDGMCSPEHNGEPLWLPRSGAPPGLPQPSRHCPPSHRALHVASPQPPRALLPPALRTAPDLPACTWTWRLGWELRKSKMRW